MFLAVGLANKDKWGKDTKTSSPEFTKRYLIALVIGTAVLVLLTGLFLFVEDKQVNTFTNVATSFDDCLEKGNPAMESEGGHLDGEVEGGHPGDTPGEMRG